MRGITPVIAIVMLLLMSVAATGGFYLIYQSFTEEGEESGSTQIESLGEQSLAQIQIESAAGGRIYVKNVGAGDVDLSKVSVYVNNRPVSVNRSADTLAERSRAVLKLTELPGCTEERCDIEISGAASTSQTVELTKLSCSSDADCYSNETCQGGVCVEEEEEEAVCGDGECSEGEHGYDCWEDCRPDSLALTTIAPSTSSFWLGQYDWNGTTYDFTSNITDAEDFRLSYHHHLFFLSNGNHLASGTAWNGDMGTYWHSKYDGSSWSYPSNISKEYDVEGDIVFSWPDVDESGNGMFIWMYQEVMPQPSQKIQWATLQDGVASDPDNATSWVSTMLPSFAFTPDNSGFLLYSNVSNFGTHNNHKVLYSHWDGSSWDDTGVVANYPNVINAQAIDLAWPLVSFADNGDGMAVWGIENKTNNIFFQYATHDGSSWTYQGNFEGWTPTNTTTPWHTELAHDHQGRPVLVAMLFGGPEVSDLYFTYDDAWSSNQSLPNASGKFIPTLSKTSDNTLFAIDMDWEAVNSDERAQWRWMVWNGNSWSDPTYTGPWQTA